MPVITLHQVPSVLKKGMSLAGLDLGTKTVGIAVSDLGLRFANPRPVLRRRKFAQDATNLAALFQHEQAAAVIIGMPLNMDGTHGARAQATRAFVRNMEAFTDIPFVFWDERLSTVAAERNMIENNVSRAKRRQRIDSAAAAFILQGALDSLSFAQDL